MDGWVVGSGAGSGDKGGAGVVQSGGCKGAKGEEVNENFFNLILGVEKNLDVHSRCKDFALLIC